MADTEQWLAGLVPGQPVAVIDMFGHTHGVAVLRVDRFTATQVIVEGLRFHRDTGQQVGRGRGPHLAPLDDPQALRIWAQAQVIRADRVIADVFKQWRDNRMDVADTLRLAREALDRASHAQNARRLPEPAPVGAGGPSNAQRESDAASE